MIRISICFVGILVLSHGGRGQAADPPKVLSEGAWSKAVSDSRGYAVRGRLVLCEKPRNDDRREVIVYIELQDARESLGGSMRLFCDLAKKDLRPEAKGGLHCELLDKDKKAIPATSFPFGGGVPASEWVTLPSDATIRLRATPYGIHRPNALAISPHLGKLWVIQDDDHNEYFLSGTFTVDPVEGRKSIEDPHIWRGTLELPALRIVNPRK